MKLTMLGTGNALVTECYNTCFVIEENRQYIYAATAAKIKVGA